jgi:uncharacterized protein YndB with AHSA1/START domain
MIVNILSGIAALIGLALIAALFIKKKYHVESSVLIQRDKDDVFDYIRYLKNQDFYSKWVMSDPNKKTEFRGIDGSVGFVYAWDSENKSAGKGEQEIVSIDENRNIDVEIRFEKPFEAVSQTRMSTEETSDGKTRVTWSMDGEQKYPMNLMNLFIGGMLVKDMDTSLNNLKNILEKKYQNG